MLPAMNKAKFRPCRALTFVALGLSAGLPFMYILLMKNKYQKFYLPNISPWPWAIGGAVYIGGALIYGFRIPEKYYPMKFDICGSSHQIFHVAVIIGFAIMFKDSLRLYNVHKEFICPITVPDTF